MMAYWFVAWYYQKHVLANYNINVYEQNNFSWLNLLRHYKWTSARKLNARNIHSHVIEHDMEALRVFASPTNKIANAIILHHPKGIYRRNIGDYLRQPYLWVKYRWSSSATLPLVDYVWIYDHILL